MCSLEGPAPFHPQSSRSKFTNLPWRQMASIDDKNSLFRLAGVRSQNSLTGAGKVFAAAQHSPLPAGIAGAGRNGALELSPVSILVEPHAASTQTAAKAVRLMNEAASWRRIVFTMQPKHPP